MSNQPENKQVNGLIAALGGFAEMTHIFYTSMIKAGASRSGTGTTGAR